MTHPIDDILQKREALKLLIKSLPKHQCASCPSTDTELVPTIEFTGSSAFFTIHCNSCGCDDSPAILTAELMSLLRVIG